MSREINNVYWEDVQVKQDLPEKSRVIDTTLIAMGATWATHDFMPVHHDRDFAQSKGAPDIFMNILTTNGFVGRYVSPAAPEGKPAVVLVLPAPAEPTAVGWLEMVDASGATLFGPWLMRRVDGDLRFAACAP